MCHVLSRPFKYKVDRHTCVLVHTRNYCANRACVEITTCIHTSIVYMHMQTFRDRWCGARAREANNTHATDEQYADTNTVKNGGG